MQNIVVAEAVRLEYDEQSGKMYIVFEIRDEKYKQYLKNNWTEDIEFKLLDKKLVQENE